MAREVIVTIAASCRARSLVSRVSSACVALCLGLAPASAQERAFVLDGERRSLVALDLGTGVVRGRAALEGSASQLFLSADGTRLLVLDAGQHKLTFCCGFQPKSPVVATVLDASTLHKIARVEVGWGAPTLSAVPGLDVLAPQLPLLPSADGRRVTIPCAGYRSKKPEETLPRELVTIELDGGRVVGRLSLDRSAEILGRVADTDTVVLFAEAIGKPRLGAEVLFVDLAQQILVARLPIDGSPAHPLLTPAGDLLYLLDPGSPSNTPEKNVDGVLHVISLGERKLLASLGAGSDPHPLVWDGERQQVLALSDGPPAKGPARRGTLRVVKGAELLVTLQVAEQPRLLRIAGTRGYVAGKGAISVVSLGELQRLGEIGLQHAEAIDELTFSKDLTRAFALFEASSRLSVLDTEGQRVVGSLTTGRGGVKFAKALGAAALSLAATSASYGAGMSAAHTQGRSFFTYNTYSFGVAPAETSVVVRPDGLFAYALNTESNDVTIVDTQTASVVSKEAAEGRALALFPNGKRLAVLGKDELFLVDTGSNRVLEPLSFEDARQVALVFAPDGRTALAWGGKDLYLLNGRTGVVRARVEELSGVSSLVFDGARPVTP